MCLESDYSRGGGVVTIPETMPSAVKLPRWQSLLVTPHRVSVHVNGALTEGEKQLGMDVYGPMLVTYRE